MLCPKGRAVANNVEAPDLLFAACIDGKRKRRRLRFMIDDNFWITNACKRRAFAFQPINERGSTRKDNIGVDWITRDNAKRITQRPGLVSRFLKSGHADICKAVKRPAFGAQADCQFAVILPCDFGFNGSIIIAAVFEERSKQVSIITRTAVDLGGVCLVLFSRTQRRQRVKLSGNPDPHQRIKSDNRNRITQRIGVGITRHFGGFVGCNR